jgi:hypothetical protein
LQLIPAEVLGYFSAISALLVVLGQEVSHHLVAAAVLKSLAAGSRR